MGLCNTEASVVFWRLWCSGVCTVWDLHFLGSAVLGVCVARGSVLLEGLCSSGLRVAPGSGFCLFPASISAIPAPSFLLQSPSPSPPAPPAPLFLLQTLPTIPAMSPPGGILPGTDPGPLLSLLLPDLLLPALRVPVPVAGSSTAAFPARPAGPWNPPLVSLRRGQDSSVGMRPQMAQPQRRVTRTQIRGLDAHPREHPGGMRAGTGTGRGVWWHQRGLLSPCCDRESCQDPVSSCERMC